MSTPLDTVDPRLMLGPEFVSAMPLFTDQSPKSTTYDMWVTGDGGTTFGSGEPIVRTIDTFLDDISVVVIDGYNTRDVVLAVWVEADTDHALDAAEADLMDQLYRANLLWWRGPSPSDAWVAFEVATSKLEPLPIGENDYDETQRRRGYTVTLTCGAWVRAKDETVVVATVSSDPGAETVVNDGSTTTGVSVVDAVGGTATVGVDGVDMEWFSTGATRLVQVTSPSTVDSDATPILRVTVTDPDMFDTLGGVGCTAQPSGGSWTSLNPPVAGWVPGDGGYAWYFALPAGYTFDQFRLTFTHSASTGYTMTLVDMRAVDEPTSVGTPRRKIFAVPISGSVPARGSFEVSHPEDALGEALIYTYSPSGKTYLPPMRPFRSEDLSATTVVIDATTTSGGYEVLDDDAVFLYPLSSLPSDVDTYDIVLYVKGTTSTTSVIDWTAEVVFGDNAVATVSGTASIVPSDAAYRYHVIGQLTLPIARLDEATLANLKVTLAPVSGPDLTFDDGYLLDTTIGDYTIVDCLVGTGPERGGAANEVTLAAPDVLWPAPSIMVAVVDDTGSGYSPPGNRVTSWGRHNLPVGDVSVLVVTANAEDVHAEARYYARGHTNLLGG